MFRALKELSFVSSNNLSINRADMFHIVKDWNAKQYESKDSNKQKPNDETDECGVAHLISSLGSDHVSAVRALEVGQRLVFKGGRYRSRSLRDYRLHAHVHTHTHRHTHRRRERHTCFS